MANFNLDGVLPNFFLIGAGKSGTTSIFHYLQEHPEIYMSSIKETNFFAFAGGVSDCSESDKEWAGKMLSRYSSYTSLFTEGDMYSARGEASGLYMFHPDAAVNIRDNICDPRFLAILRNPIDRAYSGYSMHRARGTELRSFEDVVEQELSDDSGQLHYLRGSYLAKSLYSEQLLRLFSLFPRSNFCVTLYEDFCQSPIDVMQAFYKHIGVNDRFIPNVNKKFNVGQSIDVCPVAVKERLISYFKNDVMTLQKLLGQDFSSWSII